jgi:outer membrane protein OmpA-like peptidoglycan-associated protein
LSAAVRVPVKTSEVSEGEAAADVEPPAEVSTQPEDTVANATEETVTPEPSGESEAELTADLAPAATRDRDSTVVSPPERTQPPAAGPGTADQENLWNDMLAAAEPLMVNFKLDSNELTTEDLQELDRVAALLNARPGIQAKVTGYTDAVGNLHYNLKVSEFRANIVKTYLVGKGVAAERIQSLGMGPANPIDSNDTLEGRRRNRRVEIEFQTETAASWPD